MYAYVSSSPPIVFLGNASVRGDCVADVSQFLTEAWNIMKREDVVYKFKIKKLSVLFLQYDVSKCMSFSLRHCRCRLSTFDVRLRITLSYPKISNEIKVLLLWKIIPCVFVVRSFQERWRVRCCVEYFIQSRASSLQCRELPRTFIWVDDSHFIAIQMCIFDVYIGWMHSAETNQIQSPIQLEGTRALKQNQNNNNNIYKIVEREIYVASTP